jgi:hypothetical protein
MCAYMCMYVRPEACICVCVCVCMCVYVCVYADFCMLSGMCVRNPNWKCMPDGCRMVIHANYCMICIMYGHIFVWSGICMLDLPFSMIILLNNALLYGILLNNNLLYGTIRNYIVWHTVKDHNKSYAQPFFVYDKTILLYDASFINVW